MYDRTWNTKLCLVNTHIKDTLLYFNCLKICVYIQDQIWFLLFVECCTLNDIYELICNLCKEHLLRLSAEHDCPLVNSIPIYLWETTPSQGKQGNNIYLKDIFFIK